MNNRKTNIQRRSIMPSSNSPLYSNDSYSLFPHSLGISPTDRLLSLPPNSLAFNCSKQASSIKYSFPSKTHIDSTKQDPICHHQSLFSPPHTSEFSIDNDLWASHNVKRFELNDCFYRNIPKPLREQSFPYPISRLKFCHPPEFDYMQSKSQTSASELTYEQESSSFKRFMPTVKHNTHKLSPMQSFDSTPSLSRSRPPSDRLSSTNSHNELFIELKSKDVKLKTSHSADNNLHSYSNFSDLVHPQVYESESKCLQNRYSNPLNLDNKFKYKYQSRDSEKRMLSNRNSASSLERKNVFHYPTSINPVVDNKHIFVPIIRSESTPCICPPTLRIGVKRRNGEIERPTASFSKMFNSQFHPIASTPDVSHFEDHKRFSSRSPESIPDDLSYESNIELKEVPPCDRPKQSIGRCSAEKIDLQSIEEN